MQQFPIQLGHGPLTPEQTAHLNQVFATLSPAQAGWLGGYLTAAISGGSVEALPVGMPAAVAVATVPAPSLTILVGSETGNAEGVASETKQAAEAKGLEAKVVLMDDYKPATLKSEQFMLVICSTHGEGDPPMNAEDFHEFVHGKKAPKLENLKYSVLSLGDTSYEQYCQTGKDFDAQFEKLGGTRIADRVDCDVDYEDAAAAWIESATAAMKEAIGEAAPAAAVVGIAPILGGIAAPVPASQYDKKNPFMSEILENINLNGRGSNKETRHVELDLEASGLVYQPGDALAIYPTNCPETVQLLIETAKIDSDAKVDGTSLGDLLGHTYEFTILTRPMVEKYNAIKPNKKLTTLLNEKNRKKFSEYIYGRDVIDLITDYPIEGLSPDQLIGILRKLPARLYSIASSLAAHPDEVHLTVGVTKYEAHGRQRKGVCSTYLSERTEIGTKVPVYVDGNKNFKLPTDPSSPIIMIGPGTGIAPFRAFVEERAETGATGKNWLFFGDQHTHTDFLYQAEWQNHLKSGSLTRLDLAFSRDQKHKVYVQNRIEESSKELYDWIEDGAVIYVCGDADYMAPDVNQALINALKTHGGLSDEDAAAKLKSMAKDKRYQRDVY